MSPKSSLYGTKHTENASWYLGSPVVKFRAPATAYYASCDTLGEYSSYQALQTPIMKKNLQVPSRDVAELWKACRTQDGVFLGDLNREDAIMLW